MGKYTELVCWKERKGEERHRDRQKREKSYRKLQLLGNLLFLSRSSKEIKKKLKKTTIICVTLEYLYPGIRLKQSESLQIVQDVDF